MKKQLRICAVIATLVCALICFCSCGKYNSILKAFEDAGYTESDTATDIQQSVKDMVFGKDEDGNEDRSDVTLHVLYKGDGLVKATVIIAEFKSDKALEERYEESKDLQNLVKDLQNSDYVNGNCVLVFNLASDGLTIFKNA